MDGVLNSWPKRMDEIGLWSVFSNKKIGLRSLDKFKGLKNIEHWWKESHGCA